MTKIILHGCNGHMGQTVVNIVNEKEGCEIVQEEMQRMVSLYFQILMIVM